MMCGGYKDRRLPGLTMLPIAYLHTDFLRRFLLRGKITEAEGNRVMLCLVKDGQRLYQPKDRETKGTITVHAIRDLLAAVPKVLGEFTDWTDRSTPPLKYTFKLEGPSKVDLDASQDLIGDKAPELTWEEALFKYTLLTPDELSKSIRDRRQYVAGPYMHHLSPT